MFDNTDEKEAIDENGASEESTNEQLSAITSMMSTKDRRQWFVRLICLIALIGSVVLGIVFSWNYEFAIALGIIAVMLLINECV